MNALFTAAENKQCAASLFDAYTTTLSENKIRHLLLEIFGDSFPECESSAREFLNRFILEHYPNETTIRSNFINKVLLPLNQNNISIFELPVGESRVDICKVNGHSTAYEIKTELDNFDRLNKQLTDYFDVFESVYVITSEKCWIDILDYIPSTCGVYSYRQLANGTYTFYCRKRAIRSSSLNPEKQLFAIPKKDLCETFALAQLDTAKQGIIDQCLKNFSAEHINKVFKQYLKIRYASNWRHLRTYCDRIYEVDYEWFYRNKITPEIVY